MNNKIDMQKFEYRTLSFHNLTDEGIDQNVVKKLNKLGEQGWELISVVPAKNYQHFDDPEYLLTAFFKKEIKK